MKTRLNPSLFVFISLTAAVGGVGPPLSKLVLNSIPPTAYMFLRFAMTALLLFGFMKAQGQTIEFKQLARFVPVATFGWLNIVIYSFGLNHTEATTGQFIHISIPVFTALFAFILIREKLNMIQWVGSAIAAAGVGSVIVNESDSGLASNKLLGNILVLLAGVSYAFYSAKSKESKYKDITPTAMVFVSSVSGAIATVIPFTIQFVSDPWIDEVSIKVSVSMVSLVFIFSLFYVGLQQIIKNYGPSYATTTLYLVPISVTIWAAIILSEKVSLTSAIGASLAIVGVAIVTRYRTKKINTVTTNNV